VKQAFLSYLVILSILASSSVAEFRVNSYTTSFQRDVDIAMDAAGSFVVVWDSYGQDGDSGGIFGQRFGADGNSIGSEFQINTGTTGNQKVPAVAMNAVGNFVVVWRGPGEDQNDIFAQRFDANGQVIGDEFQVNSNTVDEQLCPSVAMDNDGKFIIVWESVNTPQEGMRAICAQSYDSSGQPLGSQIRVNDQNCACRYPDVALSNSGQAIVVWIEQSATHSIWSRHFPADGNQPVLLSKKINESPNFTSLTRPSIYIDSAGNYIIAWDGHSQNHNEDDVYIRSYHWTHAPWHDQYLASNTEPGAQRNPTVAMNDTGEFVVLWEGDSNIEGMKRDISGQRFAIQFDWPAEPNRLGDQFRVNTYIVDEQRYPAVVIKEDGEFVTVWQSDGQDGSEYGIFGEFGPKKGSAEFTGDGFVNFRDFCVLAEEWRKEGNPLEADLVDDNRIDEQDLEAFCEQWLTPLYECSEVDIDSDGKIDFRDYAFLAGNWLKQGPGFDGDITGNGIVNMADLKALLFHWPQTCE